MESYEKEIDGLNDDDHELSKQHGKLLNAIEKLDKAPKWIKRVERLEPTLQVSELDLVKSGITDNDLIREINVVKPLGGKPAHRQLNKLSSAFNKKVKTLHKPEERFIAEKIKRQVGFENTKKELGKWAPIITRNRVAPHLQFPIIKQSMKMHSTDEIVKRFSVQSDLEKDLAALEPEKENTKNINKSNQFDLTLEEMMQRSKEAAKFRAQMSYKGAAARRAKKIKSKKYHRIERKAKTKRELKEFETLQKTDPQAALDKLEELNKVRAEERMSLRHKSTGQWARNKQVRAKYDKESRQVLAQQLSISRELTQKVRKTDDTDEDEEKEETALPVLSSAQGNPWVNSVKSEAEINDFITSYRTYWEKKNAAQGQNQLISNGNDQDQNILESSNNPESSVVEAKTIEHKFKKTKEHPEIKKSLKTKKLKKKKAGTSTWDVEILDNSIELPNSQPGLDSVKMDDIFETMETKLRKKVKNKIRRVKRKLKNEPDDTEIGHNLDSDDQDAGLSFPKSKRRPEIDEALDERFKNNQIMSESGWERKINSALETSRLESAKSNKNKLEIDPNAFIHVKPKHIKTLLPNDVEEGDECMDDSEKEQDQHAIINEAFAGDDVVEEFKKDKQSEIDKSLPEDIDTTLPGWGSWTGKNLKVSMRKKRRFILKVPKDAPRRDENKGNVIIIEDTSKMKQHQVKELPHPFTSVADYEASIRAPIGRDFIPEISHSRLIAPAVKTKMGKVIEPMDEDVLLKYDKLKKVEVNKQK